MRSWIMLVLFSSPVAEAAETASCHEDVAAEAPAGRPGDSVYQLVAPLTDQAERIITLDAFAGHPVVISMFYASCPSACPLLISQLKAIDAKLPADMRKETRFLLVSLDPERDDPKALLALASRHALDLSRWTLARPKPADVLTLTAVLGIKVRRLPDGNFNHSSVVTVLDGKGVVQHRQEGAQQPTEPVVAAIVKLR